jgi:hypothetical protein
VSPSLARLAMQLTLTVTDCAETFKHLVIGKHCLSRIYCSQNKVKKEFLERWKKNAWSDKEDRDDLAFWEKQKKEYLEVNPTHALAIAEMDQDFEEASL